MPPTLTARPPAAALDHLTSYLPQLPGQDRPDHSAVPPALTHVARTSCAALCRGSRGLFR